MESVQDLVEERLRIKEELQDLYHIVEGLEYDLEDVNEELKELGIGVI